MKNSFNSFIVLFYKRFRIFKRSFLLYIKKLSFPDYTTYSIYSVIIGIAAGLAAVLFHHSIEFFNGVFFERTKEGLFFLGAAAVIVIPAIGMLIQSFMITLAPETAKRKGVSEIIKVVASKGGYISFRTTLFHFIAPVVCIGSGGSVGPEGPAAQIGGGVANKIGTFFGLSEQKVRIFTAAGAGAAIAAIFNTPLGGVFFALEIVLMNDFHAPTFSSLILASVSASAVSRILIGNESVFVFYSAEFTNYSTLYLFAVLGLLSGIISVLFIKYSLSTQNFMRKYVFARGIPQWAVMIFIGLVVGVSGYFYKEIFGIGYNAINEILAGSLTWQVVLAILILKFLLVPLILYSGGFGGVFAPSLFMGAAFGFLLSQAANNLWGLNMDPVILVLVGMGAVLGGINSIPISAILIVFEMTQDYSYILPLMLAVIISNIVVQVFFKKSIHMKNLEAEGFKLSDTKELNPLRSIKVSDVELEPIDLINDKLPLPQLMSFVMSKPNSTFYTVNEGKKISGIITEIELRPIITEYEMLKDVIIARDIANPNLTLIKTTDDLDHVLNLFGRTNLDNFPVINPEKEEEIIGSITRQQVLTIYNRESLRLDLASGLSQELREIGENKPVEISPGYSLIEEPVPQNSIGKSLAELKFRNKYSIEVLLIKKYDSMFSDRSTGKIITPDPEYRLESEDKLVILGSTDSLRKFRNENY